MLFHRFFLLRERERERERERGGETEREVEKERERWRNRERGGETEGEKCLIAYTHHIMKDKYRAILHKKKASSF